MLEGLLKLLEWLVGEIGSASQRHMSRTIDFIREASARAERRRLEREKKK